MKHLPFQVRFTTEQRDLVLVGNVAFQGEAKMYFSKIVVSSTKPVSIKLYVSSFENLDGGDDVSKFILDGMSEEGQGAIISGALLRPTASEKRLMKSFFINAATPTTILDIDDKVMLQGGFGLLLSVDTKDQGEVSGCFVWEEGSTFNTPNVQEVTTDPKVQNTDGE